MQSADSALAITPRGAEIPDGAGFPFEAQKVGREMLRATRLGTLSTLDPNSGYPYGAVTNVATDHDGTPIFLMAAITIHARNVAADSRASLALADMAVVDSLSVPRLTLVGRVERVPAADVERVKARFLRRHKKSKAYVALPDARFYRLVPESLQLNGGPGRNASALVPADLMSDLAGADDLLAVEENLLARINGSPEGLAAIARRLGDSAREWKATGLDPDGLDVQSGMHGGRIGFSQRVTSPKEFIQALMQEAPVA